MAEKGRISGNWVMLRYWRCVPVSGTDQRQSDRLGRNTGTYGIITPTQLEGRWLVHRLFKIRDGLDIKQDVCFPLTFILKDKLLRARAGAGLLRTTTISSFLGLAAGGAEERKTAFRCKFSSGWIVRKTHKAARTTSKRREDARRIEAGNNETKRCSMPATAEDYQLFQVPGLLCNNALCLFFKTAAHSRPWNPHLDSFT